MVSDQETTTNDWTTIIRPRSGWFDINLFELWRYKDLIALFVRRDFISVYKQTILGPIWFLLQPLFTTFVFVIVFGKIARISTDGLPPVLFYMIGIVTWNYFSACLIKTSDTFTTNAAIFGKVYFPRLAVPLSIIITNLMAFTIQFMLFLLIALYLYFKGVVIKPNEFILLTPLLLLQMASLGLGFGVLISSLTTKYRDLTHVVAFGVQLWMYATPVVYPLSEIPERWRLLYSLNPMVTVLETFRYAFLGSGVVHYGQYLLSLSITLLLLTAGIILFSRIEKTFMDTI